MLKTMTMNQFFVKTLNEYFSKVEDTQMIDVIRSMCYFSNGFLAILEHLRTLRPIYKIQYFNILKGCKNIFLTYLYPEIQ